MESGCLGMQPKRGGRHHPKLNMGTRPIANKYREGRMKSTLEGGSKEGVKPLICKRVAGGGCAAGMGRGGAWFLGETSASRACLG